MSEAPTDQSQTVDEKTIIHFHLASSHSLGQRLVANCGFSARFEPKTEDKMAVVTTSNKILIDNDETSLSMKDKVRCIAAAPFGNGYDFIVVGTESQVILYDIYSNVTVFTRDIPDGVNCFMVGKLAERDTVIYCGGNCAIWGFDQNGTDVYWTVTGDAVTTMCLCDYDLDGQNELIIGSPDNEIRIFKDDLMRKELMETDAVLKLANVGNNIYAYALSNGTLGAYKKDERLWRIKSKHLVTDILNFPSTPEQCTSVWDNGKKDVRLTENGDQLASFTHETQVVAAFIKNTPNGVHLVTASVDGVLDAYSVEGRTEKIDKTQETLREFGQQKHNLLMELSNFEAEEAMKESDKKKEMRIPANTTVDCIKHVNMEERILYLKLQASNEVCIRGVIAFAEGMFEGDSYIWIPNKFVGSGDKLLLPLLCEKNNDCEISLRTFLGHIDADRLFIFECFISIQKFSRFLWCHTFPQFKESEYYVDCHIKVRMQRIVDWIQDNFTVIEEHIPQIDKDEKEVDFHFVELAPRKELYLTVKVNTNKEKITIHCDCMETTGDILQSLAEYVGAENVSSICHFPKYFNEVNEIVEQMDEMYDVQARLNTDLNSQCSMVKEIIVRAEDTIYINDMELARKYYNRLKISDTAMKQAFLLKQNQHEALVKGLRRLNKIIEYAAKLRVGTPGRDIVAACRNAIRDDNKVIIVKVLQFGAKE